MTSWRPATSPRRSNKNKAVASSVSKKRESDRTEQSMKQPMGEKMTRTNLLREVGEDYRDGLHHRCHLELICHTPHIQQLRILRSKFAAIDEPNLPANVMNRKYSERRGPTMSTNSLIGQDRRISTSDFPPSFIGPVNNFLKYLLEVSGKIMLIMRKM